MAGGAPLWRYDAFCARTGDQLSELTRIQYQEYLALVAEQGHPLVPGDMYGYPGSTVFVRRVQRA